MHTALLETFAHQGRDLVRLRGPDTRRFMQGTVTADVDNLDAATATAACLCTVKGKIVSELVVLTAGDDAIDLLVPRQTAAAVAESLDRHVIMDDVEVASPEPVAVAVAWEGETAPPVAAAEGVRVFTTRHPGPGTLVLGTAEAVAAALPGGSAVDEAGWTAHRIATATPAWGHEILADAFPPEVGFVHAVSYDKGCFLGQEPLARIHARGQVNRVMVRVRLEDLSALPATPPVGGPPLQDADGNAIGRLSSWARSPNAPADETGGVGLAIVRRSVASPGHILHSAGQPVHVLTPPLGDDPGVGATKRSATVKLGRR